MSKPPDNIDDSLLSELSALLEKSGVSPDKQASDVTIAAERVQVVRALEGMFRETWRTYVELKARRQELLEQPPDFSQDYEVCRDKALNHALLGNTTLEQFYDRQAEVTQRAELNAQTKHLAELNAQIEETRELLQQILDNITKVVESCSTQKS